MRRVRRKEESMREITICRTADFNSKNGTVYVDGAKIGRLGAGNPRDGYRVSRHPGWHFAKRQDAVNAIILEYALTELLAQGTRAGANTRT
jgi:hypothetical protein